MVLSAVVLHCHDPDVSTTYQEARAGQLFCRTCSALPSGAGKIGRAQCPWCRSPLTREFGLVVARCAECPAQGIVGTDLVTREYDRGHVAVPRAVCRLHVEANAAEGSGPSERTLP